MTTLLRFSSLSYRACRTRFCLLVNKLLQKLTWGFKHHILFWNIYFLATTIMFFSRIYSFSVNPRVVAVLSPTLRWNDERNKNKEIKNSFWQWSLFYPIFIECKRQGIAYISCFQSVLHLCVYRPPFNAI